MDKEPLVMKATAGINTNDLPEGVIGAIEAIFVRYNTVDQDGEMFAPGCLSKTVQQRVASGKVKLYGAFSGAGHTRDLDSFAGQVVKVTDTPTHATLTAHIADTPGGRKLYDFCKACAKAGMEIGVSLGGAIVKKSQGNLPNGAFGTIYNEIQLREVSVVGDPSIPGAYVTVVKATEEDLTKALKALVAPYASEIITKSMTEVLAELTPVQREEEVVEKITESRPTIDAEEIQEPEAVADPGPVYLSWEERMAVFRANSQ